jgi:hypothetical protein
VNLAIWRVHSYPLTQEVKNKLKVALKVVESVSEFRDFLNSAHFYTERSGGQHNLNVPTCTCTLLGLFLERNTC